jgi:hypothetical protein
MIRKVLTFFGGKLYILQSSNEDFPKELISISFRESKLKLPPLQKRIGQRFSPLAKGSQRGFWKKSLAPLEYGDIKFSQLRRS